MITDTDKRFCSLLFDVMEAKGVKDIVCSPGSRNAPLLLAASARNSLKKHFVIDERAAGFMAYGLALVSRKPVALVCTSGTALLNYSPAVAEAYYHGVPLVVISADRPMQWIDQEDSQTIRQPDALANFVKKSYNMPVGPDNDSELLWYVNRITNDALITACSQRPGPVHLNVPLAEPLGLKKIKNSDTPRIIEFIQADSIGNKEIIRQLAMRVAKSKVMLVAGFMSPDSALQKSVSSFARFPNVAVMAETISNLHLTLTDYSVDSVLTAYDKSRLEELSPDLIISVGGSLVSRKLKEYLRKNIGNCEHWAIGYTHTTVDCFQSLSLRIETDITRFFRSLSSSLSKLQIAAHSTGYKDSWLDARKKALQIKNTFVDNSPWSELQAFNLILNNIPGSCNLLLSNGTPIRYDQIITHKLPHSTWCNRGVSGIDGTVATAVGAAKSYPGVTLLITGDLSLSYDIGSLGLKEIPDRLKIIVIDNEGGGIFRFISSTSGLEEREKYFCMKPDLSLKEIAEGFGWEYMEADSENSLSCNLKKLYSSTHKTILRVVCDGVRSAEILKAYMKIKC
ncbi:MAG: 2-succinyl-5-enolpyruvyl-6-hydroxy-3-cyclohexene-1-carboxylic-acid synthase [Muribaculaceae bacterium]|nr:2-succinyl-5-enolpyruvyl-6-hydroxy-3-cyclohexene-1-carboxylic-acid synthase [Muribaculaceae bacterium]